MQNSNSNKKVFDNLVSRTKIYLVIIALLLILIIFTCIRVHIFRQHKKKK